MEGNYRQTCDVLTGELVTGFQIENCRNRPLCPEADGVGLENIAARSASQRQDVANALFVASGQGRR